MKQEMKTSPENEQVVNQNRRETLSKLKYAPPVIATLLATDSAWAQVSGSGTPPPPPGPTFP